MANGACAAQRSDLTMVAFSSPSGDNLDFRLREAREHGGEVVARLSNGVNFYAETYASLYQLLADRGVNAQEASMEEIPSLGEYQMY